MSRTAIVLIVILAIFAMPPSYALTSSSSSYKLINGSFSSAGGLAASESYRLTDCLAPEIAVGGTSTSPSYVLQSSCAAAVTAFLPVDDDDGDGVAGGIEDGAPNNGDGNNDGIRDRVQGQVVSLLGTGGVKYKTFEVCGDAQCSSICQATAVRSLLEEDLPQDSAEYEFPYGLLEFSIDCPAADIRILHFDEDWSSSILQYVNFGPNPPGSPFARFYMLENAVFGSDIIPGAGEVGSVNFRLEDGVTGDDTGPDGIIISRGGPAVYTPLSVPALGLAGLFITIVVMFFTAIFTRRRAAGFRRST